MSYKKLKARNGTVRGAPIKDEREIALSLSSNIQTNGENTTFQLTAPSGKSTSDFSTGKIQDDLNPSSSVDIGDSKYTELEWCLKATDLADSTATYQFRVLVNGVVLDTYTVTPQITLNTSQIYSRVLSEALDVNDDGDWRSAQRNRFIPQEAVALIDTLIRTQVHGRTTQEAIAVNETLLRFEKVFRLLHEDITATDTLIQSAILFRLLIEPGLTVTEQIIRSKTFGRTTSDSFAVSDAVIRGVQAFRLCHEDVDVNDAVFRFCKLYRRLVDGVDIFDYVFRTIVTDAGQIITRVIQEQVQLSDVLLRFAERNRFATDTLVVSESIARYMVRNRIITDVVEASDAAIRYTLLRRLLTEPLEVTDSLRSVITFYQNLVGFVTATLETSRIVVSTTKAQPIELQTRATNIEVTLH